MARPLRHRLRAGKRAGSGGQGRAAGAGARRAARRHAVQLRAPAALAGSGARRAVRGAHRGQPSFRRAAGQ